MLSISNDEAESIIETALDFWRTGRDREEIELKDLEESLSFSIFNNEKSGFYHSSLIENNLVDFFVPFLPLEYSHVVQCIMAEMKIRASKGNGKPNLDVAHKDPKDHTYPGLLWKVKHWNNTCRKVCSNAGGSIIVETALDFWRAGRAREEIDLRDIEKALSVSIFNNVNSGFFHTSLIKNNLVDFFVPFLPLEYSHVVQCITAKMKTRANKRKGLLDMDVIDQITTDVLDFPKTEQVFSSKGCKTIDSKLEYYTSNESFGQCLITGSKDSDSQEAKERERI
ncbi:Torsin-1A [Oryzias melastigma]|uniref:Torsin-1A n=1 Tax=Oryzias melastigma TaxID=30732 RepID=A0A834F4Q0_ORYME|nr:Torsin-1A [Oryzias melastigma]